MSIFGESVTGYLDVLRSRLGESAAAIRLTRHAGAPAAQLRVRRANTRDSLRAIWSALRQQGASEETERVLVASLDDPAIQAHSAAIESLAGLTTVPLGVLGPLRVNGLHANGDFFVPLATTEAALVASYARGAQVVGEAGGVSAAVLYEGVIRTPAFIFDDIAMAGAFVAWLVECEPALRAAAEATTRHGRLLSIEPVIDSDVVFLRCRYATGDAAGQNMVTIATDALCRHIVAHAPTPPRRWYIEGNFSSDKKASYLGFMTGRGRKVSASVVLPGSLVEKRLHVGVEQLIDYFRVAELGARLSGQIGAQGHVANGLAALYLATGQDVACVAESAVGSTRMEARGGDLCVSLTLPNLLVGTVGGGTSLPAQVAALDIIGLKGAGSANGLAELATALCLCGEISIIAAIAAGHFTRAHRKLARERR